jgi:hypothetical protein
MRQQKNMAWPLGAKLTILLALTIAFGFGVTPARIINRAWFLLYHSPAVLFSSLRVPPPAPHTLKAAILNVTTDFNELSRLIQEFMESSHADPALESAFRQFLAHRATRSHPGLENILDWVLALYKFAFPFVIISFLARLTGGGDNGGMLVGEHSGGVSPTAAAVVGSSSKRLAAKVHRKHSSGSPATPTPSTPNDWNGTSTRLSQDIFGNGALARRSS